jgi:hypothetical protein
MLQNDYVPVLKEHELLHAVSRIQAWVVDLFFVTP